MNYILKAAKSYIGMKEKPNNGGFTDAGFERMMRKEGEWQTGWAWCACFAQVCCYVGLTKENFAKLDPLLTPSVMRTYNNLLKAGYNVSKEPKAGTLVFWQLYKDGKPTPFGHIGICSDTKVAAGFFPTVEGNTNAAGSREGDCVAEKTRALNFDIPKGGDGLRLLGFIEVADAVQKGV